MVPDRDFAVLDLPQLVWPANISIPSRRFRMLVAANVDSLTSETMAEFARCALKRGMVYFCAWGKGCERFHDIVDEVMVVAESSGPEETSEDVVMTTWHKDQSLEEALDFLATCACPTDGLMREANTGWCCVWVQTGSESLATFLRLPSSSFKHAERWQSFAVECLLAVCKAGSPAISPPRSRGVP